MKREQRQAKQKEQAAKDKSAEKTTESKSVSDPSSASSSTAPLPELNVTRSQLLRLLRDAVTFVPASVPLWLRYVNSLLHILSIIHVYLWRLCMYSLLNCQTDYRSACAIIDEALGALTHHLSFFSEDPETASVAVLASRRMTVMLVHCLHFHINAGHPSSASNLLRLSFGNKLTDNAPADHAKFSMAQLQPNDRLLLWLCGIHMSAFGSMPAPPMLPTDLSPLWALPSTGDLPGDSIDPRAIGILETLSTWFTSGSISVEARQRTAALIHQAVVPFGLQASLECDEKTISARPTMACALVLVKLWADFDASASVSPSAQPSSMSSVIRSGALNLNITAMLRWAATYSPLFHLLLTTSPSGAFTPLLSALELTTQVTPLRGIQLFPAQSVLWYARAQRLLADGARAEADTLLCGYAEYLENGSVPQTLSPSTPAASSAALVTSAAVARFSTKLTESSRLSSSALSTSAASSSASPTRDPFSWMCYCLFSALRLSPSATCDVFRTVRTLLSATAESVR